MRMLRVRQAKSRSRRYLRGVTRRKPLSKAAIEERLGATFACALPLTSPP